jgi:starch phosphorylase
VVNWEQTLKEKWRMLHFGGVKAETRGEQHVFEVEVYLNGLDSNAVRVELYADGTDGGAPARQEMKLIRQLTGASGGHIYSAAVSAARSQTDYTARVIAHRDGVAIPLENAQILWQR